MLIHSSWRSIPDVDMAFSFRSLSRRVEQSASMPANFDVLHLKSIPAWHPLWEGLSIVTSASY